LGIRRKRRLKIREELNRRERIKNKQDLKQCFFKGKVFRIAFR
jgi:hypothetical protein